jgi:hypothetical protein
VINIILQIRYMGCYNTHLKAWPTVKSPPWEEGARG